MIMKMIKNKTAITIRTQLMIFQLHSLIDATVKDKLLKGISQHCIPKKSLKNIWIMGTCDGRIHAKMNVSIDYEANKSPINIKAFFGDKVFVASQDTDTSEASNMNDLDEKINCPVWADAVSWFVKLCQQENVELNWGIVLSDDYEEIVEKYGLQLSMLKDATTEMKEYDIPNPGLSELNMGISFSSEKFGSKEL